MGMLNSVYIGANSQKASWGRAYYRRIWPRRRGHLTNPTSLMQTKVTHTALHGPWSEVPEAFSAFRLAACESRVRSENLLRSRAELDDLLMTPHLPIFTIRSVSLAKRIVSPERPLYDRKGESCRGTGQQSLERDCAQRHRCW